VRLGSATPDNFLLGSSQVDKMYLGSNLVWEYDTSYEITKALDVYDTDMPLLRNTISPLVTHSSTKEGTYAFWLKRTESNTLTGYINLIGYNSYSGVPYSFMLYQGRIRVSAGSRRVQTVSQVIDTAYKWYHITIIYNSTDLAASNRMQIYVNGVRETLEEIDDGYPTQNANCPGWDRGTYLCIGAHINSNGHKDFDGGFSLADVWYFDGQVYAGSNFYDTTTNTAKDPSSLTLGNQGFHLDFSDNSVNTNENLNQGAGKDASGNLTEQWFTTDADYQTTSIFSDSIGVNRWTPADIDTAVWYDANEYSTIALSGLDVTEWRDKSGNGRDTIRGASEDPHYETSAFSGFPAVTNSTNHDWYEISDSVGVATTGEFILAIAAKKVTGDMIRVLTKRATNGDLNFYLTPNQTNKNRLTVRDNAGSAKSSDYGGGGIDTNEHILTGQYVSNQITSFYDGDGAVPVTATGPLESAAHNITIGSFDGNANTSIIAKMRTAEIIIVTGADATAANREKIEGYLAWKYGVESNLPSGHAYANSAPTA
jgi:hypothetical protein